MKTITNDSQTTQGAINLIAADVRAGVDTRFGLISCCGRKRHEIDTAIENGAVIESNTGILAVRGQRVANTGSDLEQEARRLIASSDLAERNAGYCLARSLGLDESWLTDANESEPNYNPNRAHARSATIDRVQTLARRACLDDKALSQQIKRTFDKEHIWQLEPEEIKYLIRALLNLVNMRAA